MSNFDSKVVMELRCLTNSGVMACKQALVEADGDFEKAKDILRKKGMASAAKKASRKTSEGMVYAIANQDKNVGVCVEVNSETDFVARNDSFKSFVKTLAELIIQKKPDNLESLLNLEMENGNTVAAKVTEAIAVIGENIVINRFVVFDGTFVETYNHGEGRIGVIAKFSISDLTKVNDSEFLECTKNVCMHIAALAPTFIKAEDVDQAAKEKEMEIAREQFLTSGKPANVIDKMVEGKLQKYFKERCLYEQEYVKDPSQNVFSYVNSVAKKLGCTIAVESFARLERGE